MYSQERRQKKSAIWMRLAWHPSNEVESAAAAAWTTMLREVAFSCLDGGS